jgi:hypothetical protein
MGMAVVAAVTVFVGFAPTFYLRGYMTLRADQAALSPLLLLHGLVGTAWIALFLAQTFLVVCHRIHLHRRLGILGATVAAFLGIVGTMTAIDALRRGVGPFGLDPRIWFLSVPLAGIVLFAVLVTTALVLRHRPEAHKRLMLLATITLLNPALGRLVGRYLEVGLSGFLILIFTLTDVFVIVAVLHDLRTRRNVHPALVWGGSTVVIFQPLLLAVGNTSAWLTFADLLR